MDEKQTSAKNYGWRNYQYVVCLPGIEIEKGRCHVSVCLRSQMNPGTETVQQSSPDY